jgi:5-(carboxyamino)imidazole ribonucleotide synthase
MEKDVLDKKIGILGAGQLGKMICEAGSDWNLKIHLLDKSNNYPASTICHSMTLGDFNNYDDVLAFGADKDIVSIEIEGVNVDALLELENQGKEVYPSPKSLAIIKDKGLQKQFYQASDFPSSPFNLYDDIAALKNAIDTKQLQFPFVWKARTGGYDGKGVAVIKNLEDLNELNDQPCLIEDLVDIDKELAVIVARNKSGDCKAFPMVEMEFNPDANLVEYLFCPANVSEELSEKAEAMAIDLINKFDTCGLLAIEFFLTKNGALLINEVAPRAHNSGHHTIESCITSQFQQFLRAILNLPLGETHLIRPSVMVNLLGAPGHQGKAKYVGLKKCLNQNGTYLHLYGKEETRPFRKMGHATLLDADLDAAKEKAKFVKQTLQIIS